MWARAREVDQVDHSARESIWLERSPMFAVTGVFAAKGRRAAVESDSSTARRGVVGCVRILRADRTRAELLGGHAAASASLSHKWGAVGQGFLQVVGRLRHAFEHPREGFVDACVMSESCSFSTLRTF